LAGGSFGSGSLWPLRGTSQVAASGPGGTGLTNSHYLT